MMPRCVPLIETWAPGIGRPLPASVTRPRTVPVVVCWPLSPVTETPSNGRANASGRNARKRSHDQARFVGNVTPYMLHPPRCELRMSDRTHLDVPAVCQPDETSCSSFLPLTRRVGMRPPDVTYERA